MPRGLKSHAGMALCDRFEVGDVTRLIRTGETVTVIPEEGGSSSRIAESADPARGTDARP